MQASEFFGVHHGVREMARHLKRITPDGNKYGKRTRFDPGDPAILPCPDQVTDQRHMGTRMGARPNMKRRQAGDDSDKRGAPTEPKPQKAA